MSERSSGDRYPGWVELKGASSFFLFEVVTSVKLVPLWLGNVA